MKCNEIHFALPASFQTHRVNSQHEALTAGNAVFRDEKRKEKKKEQICSQELTALCKARYNSI